MHSRAGSSDLGSAAFSLPARQTCPPFRPAGLASLGAHRCIRQHHREAGGPGPRESLHSFPREDQGRTVSSLPPSLLTFRGLSFYLSTVFLLQRCTQTLEGAKEPWQRGPGFGEALLLTLCGFREVTGLGAAAWRARTIRKGVSNQLPFHWGSRHGLTCSFLLLLAASRKYVWFY